jgi:hypothetical protein
VGGVGNRVVFWTWPALEAACARVYMCVRASASAGGWGGGSPLVVHRGQDAEVAVGDRKNRDASASLSVLEPLAALLRPPRGPARLALRNLGLVELLAGKCGWMIALQPESSRPMPPKSVRTAGKHLSGGLLLFY